MLADQPAGNHGATQPAGPSLGRQADSTPLSGLALESVPDVSWRRRAEASAEPLGPSLPGALRVTRWLARGAAILALAVGGLVLLGWTIDSAWLKGAVGVPITMKANAALCFVLTGLALLMALERNRLAAFPAILVATVGGLTFSQHLTGWDVGIDQWLYREIPDSPATASPGRMGPPGSLSFFLLGLSLALLDVRLPGGRHPFRYVPLATTAIALLSLVGYAYGLPALYSVDHLTGIDWPTSVTLLCVSIGGLIARPENGVVRLLCAANMGGLAARRLILPALAIPFLVLLAYGMVRDQTDVSPRTGRGVVAVLMMAALTGMVLRASHHLAVASERQARSDVALRESEARYRSLIELLPVTVFVCEAPSGVITFFNAQAAAMWGRRAESGETDQHFYSSFAIFTADGARIDPDATPMSVALREGREFRNAPLVIERPDGERVHVLASIDPLRDSQGRVTGTINVFHDTTRLITIQEALRRSEESIVKLAAIVESSDDAIMSQNLSGRITTWNSGAERMFGYSASEAIGQSVEILLPPEAEREHRTIAERISRGEAISHYETVRRRKDGSLVDVSLSISPIYDPNGVISGASRIARDITNRKRLEQEREALLDSERAARLAAERAARARDEFLAIISHELRTPLNAVLGWSQYLKRGKHDARTMAEAVDAIERGARAQAQLIEDLLDMNRITTGRLPLSISVVDLAAVVEAAIGTVRPAIESKQIQLNAVLDTRIGPVSGDSGRLQQVVWNLLSNAVKFTPKGGRIDVLLQMVDSQVELVIRDTGAGIRPDFLPHVFERFRQADASITRAHGGLGLGLSIVKHLVELHGGTVHAESAGDGQGSTFTVRLPLSPLREGRRQSTAVQVSHEVSDVDLSNVRVLVVDDDSETRELVKRVLTEHRAHVVTADSAAQALEILAHEKLDVLVSDIGMPQMDGYQFIRNVRDRLHLGSDAIPAVALTAYARSEDRTKAMLAGYQMHIAKPIEPQELVATVANFAGRTTRSDN